MSESTPWRTHSWGIPADREILSLAGVKSVEFWVDDEDNRRGKLIFEDDVNAGYMIERLAADGWHYDMEEGAWVK